MDYDEDENRPLGDFGSLLGVPAAADAEELALNEQLDLTGAAARAWLVKLPNFLLERWTSVQNEGQEIGRIRLYDSPNPDKPTEAVVLLPDAVAKPEDLDDSQQIPNEYKLNMQQLESHNLYAFTEKNPPEPDSDARGPPQAGPSSAGSQSEAQNGQSANPRKRAREPALVARVAHECNLVPDVTSPAYSAIIRQRQHLATQPKRVLKNLGGTQAEQNRLATGAVDFSKDPKKANLFIKNAKRPGQSRDKLVRLPANEVRDMIFAAFEEYDYWSLKSLKERIKQPETYLRDLLQEIAQQNGAGPYQGLYSLLPAFKRQRTEGEGPEAAGPEAAGGSSSAAKDESEDEMEPV